MKTLIIPGKMKYVFTIMVLTGLFISSSLTAQDINHNENHQMNDSVMKQRQEMIHSRSPMVMPFNMNKVTHYFISTGDGGILMIKAKDPKDTLQISLIRSHLKKESVLFSKADFKDPRTLHGMNMPGLEVLSGSENKFNVQYKKLSDGAKLTFASKDTTVINAIHVWFDAQLRDHGKDARSKE